MKTSVALIGHPHAPIGMGEHVRCTYRSLRAVARRPALVDIYAMNDPAQAGTLDLVPHVSDTLGEINIFHINADEVEQALATLGDRVPSNAYNIIYPAWELSRFPQTWIRQLERFDEAWAPSEFIADALRRDLRKPVTTMPLATEVLLESFLSRRYFGLPEDAYVFLFFYDFRSYATRKNPLAVLDAFERVVADAPFEHIHLAVKTHAGGTDNLGALLKQRPKLASRVTILERTMTDNEIKNLVRNCDAFVSLHRSEGYGRGMAEAMFLGKPVIATGYSGNTTFMRDDNSLLVPYTLRPLVDGDYPHWQAQSWAEPDLDAAVAMMRQLVADPRRGEALGRRARADVRRELSYRATGNRYVARLNDIAAMRTAQASPIRASES